MFDVWYWSAVFAAGLVSTVVGIFGIGYIYGLIFAESITDESNGSDI